MTYRNHNKEVNSNLYVHTIGVPTYLYITQKKCEICIFGEKTKNCAGNTVRKCKGICNHDQKLMKVTINFIYIYIRSFIIYSTL